MAIKHVAFNIDSIVYNKVEKKAKRLGFKDVEQYAEAFLRRSSIGSQRKSLKDIDPIVSKFAKPTKKTYKILRTIKVIR